MHCIGTRLYPDLKTETKTLSYGRKKIPYERMLHNTKRTKRFQTGTVHYLFRAHFFSGCRYRAVDLLLENHHCVEINEYLPYGTVHVFILLVLSHLFVQSQPSRNY